MRKNDFFESYVVKVRFIIIDFPSFGPRKIGEAPENVALILFFHIFLAVASLGLEILFHTQLCILIKEYNK